MDATLVIDGREVLVDSTDVAFVQSSNWQLYKSKSGRLYVCGSRGRLHRILLAAPRGMQVDHRNGNTLDNRRDNLRLCTHQQNQWNRKRSPGLSRYKGVSHFRPGSAGRHWRARIEKHGKRYFLGDFATQLEAALAYDAAAVQLFGEFAAPNFPERFTTP